ncbi:PLD nuclease N-terminal domain-containing protein [Microbacterium terricola]|uniref:Cardiolipin synthase N-terminal domain-containing protein n=1 Tax=Microbacterium terricola TaxID=344163 RepID=A0ABM8E088_9MICO|nr:PLD nuclease N-terminal domain-containing protein [Microbacterium terricola]UYK41081.1 PLD nuclease N-terminal domain-containing protein [Microbacterium terricola]BDV31160.1 hypothetical protein Microterr_18200 [Microbacterium terricola]
MPYVFSLLVVGAMIFALVDIITRDEWQVKHLPRWAWLLMVLVLPFIGTVLWFALGREYTGGAARAQRAPARQSAPTGYVAPTHGRRSTEEQLADLEREIEEERLRAEIARRARDQASEG